MDSFVLSLALALGGALLISWFLTAGMLRWAPRLGLIDHPSDRKFHVRKTPKGGGLAIYAAFAATVAVVAPERLLELRTASLLGIGFLIVVLGMIADVWPLPWQIRLAAQALAALAVFGSPPQTGWLPPALAVIWVVGLVNAFNMLDNMDSLSAGVAAIAALFCALVLLVQPDRIGYSIEATRSTVLFYVALLGALLGFLWFNRPPARIFMGDAGSTFLGFFFGVRTLQDGLAVAGEPATWAVPLCLLAVPWYDMTAVILLRLSQGRSPFHADKQHLSHRLVDLGLSGPAAVGAIHGLALAAGATAVLAAGVEAHYTLLLAWLTALGWAVVAALDYYARKHWLPASGLMRKENSHDPA